MSQLDTSKPLPIYATAEHLRALDSLIERLDAAVRRAEALTSLPAEPQEIEPVTPQPSRRRMASIKGAFAAAKLEMGLGLLVGLLGLVVTYIVFFGGIR